jgi:hypothetical protein
VEQTSLQDGGVSVLVFSDVLVRPNLGTALGTILLRAHNEAPWPGSAGFARASRSLDVRAFGYRVAKRAFGFVLQNIRGIILAITSLLSTRATASLPDPTGSGRTATRSVIEECCPKYLAAWDNLMKSTRVHVFNMFVMPPTCSMPTARGCFPCLRRLVRGSTRVTWTPSLLAGRGAQVGGCWTHGLSTASRMPSSRWLAQSRWTGSRRAPRSWRQSSWARST